MIVIAFNEVMNAIDLMVDEEGADLLIDKLTKLKTNKSGHYHLMAPNDLKPTSPYGHATVYQELIMDWVERD